jgi:tetratricopeptide (TPR) repeat protein
MKPAGLALLALLAAAPAWAQQPKPPDRTGPLLDALKAAPDAPTATLLEQQIEQAWLHAGTPAVTLLMSRALREAGAGSDHEALEDFDAALDLDPDLAEAWHQRALVQYHMGDVPGAIRDLEQALRLQPNQFAALQTLSRIAEARGDWKGAYAAWQKVLAIDPRTPDAQSRLRELRRRAYGQDT